MKKIIINFFIILNIINIIVGTSLSLGNEAENKILEFLIRTIEKGAKEVKTFSANITTTMYYSKKGEEVKLNFSSMNPDKWRIDLTGPQKIAGGIISSDGEYLYRYIPALKKVQKTKIKGGVGEDLMKTYVGFLADYALKKGEKIFEGLKIKYAGKETVNGVETYALKVLPKEDDEFSMEQTIYFNSKTGIPTKLLITYKGGLLRKLEVSIENVKINEELDNKKFTIPDNFKG